MTEKYFYFILKYCNKNTKKIMTEIIREENLLNNVGIEI
jgi:hypothetical protein